MQRGATICQGFKQYAAFIQIENGRSNSNAYPTYRPLLLSTPFSVAQKYVIQPHHSLSTALHQNAPPPPPLPRFQTLFMTVLPVIRVRGCVNSATPSQNHSAPWGHSANLSPSLPPPVPPEWISKPKDAEAVEGEDVFFPCSVSGVPEPLITWRKMAGE